MSSDETVSAILNSVPEEERSHTGTFSIELDYLNPPALVCSYDLKSIRSDLLTHALRVLAFLCVARERGLDSPTGEELLKNRGWVKLFQNQEIVDEALALSVKPEFFIQFARHAQAWVEAQMRLLTPDNIERVVRNAFDGLLVQAVDQVKDEILVKTQGAPRSNAERQAALVNRGRRLASELLNVNSSPGRPKGGGSDSPVFTYDKFCNAVRYVDANEAQYGKGRDHLPKQKYVARQMGYGSSVALKNAIDAHPEIFKNRGHTSLKWEPLCREILDRN